jgi:hypothetical protein
MTSSFLGRHDYVQFETAAWTTTVDLRGLGTCYDRSRRIKIDFALNRPVEDWGKLLGDSAAVTAMLDRLLHHGHVLKCGPRSWRTKTGNTGDAQ